jgi:hypothetical protein
MSNVKKTIQVNPAFLSLSRKNKTKKYKEKKNKRKNLRMSIKPNNIKKKLIAKIKEHQRDNLEKRNINTLNKTNEIKENQKFAKDFNEQLNYLEQIIQRKKEKKRRKKMHRKTKRKEKMNHNTNRIRHMQQKNNIRSNLISNQNAYQIAPEPPYGCLKNGSKPTYSQYKKTLKMREKLTKHHKNPINVSEPKPKVLIEENTIQPSLVSREDKLARLKARLAMPKKKNNKDTLIKVKKTIKKYKLGKNEKNRVIGVLVKSGKTRKLIKNEQNILRKKCLSEIKQYLRKHNLIKTGSSAPESVLRKLYEDSFLSGNVYNKNTANLLHNYLNNE